MEDFRDESPDRLETCDESWDAGETLMTKYFRKEDVDIESSKCVISQPSYF